MDSLSSLPSKSFPLSDLVTCGERALRQLKSEESRFEDEIEPFVVFHEFFEYSECSTAIIIASHESDIGCLKKVKFVKLIARYPFSLCR